MEATLAVAGASEVGIYCNPGLAVSGFDHLLGGSKNKQILGVRVNGRE